MLSTNSVKLILDKLKMPEIEFDLESKDEFGDYIRVLLVDTEFRTLKTNILDTKFFSSKINDISPTFIKMVLKDQYQGFNFYYNAKLESIAGGTRITLATKRVDYATDEGVIKHLLSFEMLRAYKETFEN